MTSNCDLCGDENCIPVLNDRGFETDSHTCEQHCKEATGMDYAEYVKAHRFHHLTIGSAYYELKQRGLIE